jgi:RNA polymerase sigma factor (sigma-70 family)
LSRWLLGSPFSRCEQEAEEILAKTYERVWLKRSTYDPTRPIEPWFYGYLNNLLREYSRQSARQAKPLGTHEPSVEETVAQCEQDKHFAQLLDQFVPDDRNLLYWAVVENKSYREIAALLNSTEGAIRTVSTALKPWPN